MSLRLSLLLSFAQRYTELGLQFVSTIILSRLLSPDEIGVFSVVAALVLVAHVMRDFGVQQYVVRCKELTPERQGAAFALTFLIAWPMALLLYLLAPLLGDFYNDTRVVSATQLLAVNFAVIPFGSVIISILTRDMRFGALYVIRSLSALVHAVSAIVLALNDFGYLAMPWAALAGTVTTVCAAQFYRPADFRLRWSFAEIKSALSFGSKSTSGLLLGVITEGLPESALGKMASMEEAGLFSRAMGTVMLFNRSVYSGIRPLLLPHLSAKVRDGEGLYETVRRASDFLTVIALPFYGLLAVMAAPVIHLLYGGQWLAATPATQLLCLAAFISSVQPMWTDIALAMSRMQFYVRTYLLQLALTVLVIAVTSHAGLLWLAVGMVARSIVFTIWCQYGLRKETQYGLRDFFWFGGRGVLVTLGTALPAIAGRWSGAIPDDAAFWILALTGLACLLCWLLMLVLLRHPLLEEMRNAARKLPFFKGEQRS